MHSASFYSSVSWGRYHTEQVPHRIEAGNIIATQFQHSTLYFDAMKTLHFNESNTFYY